MKKSMKKNKPIVLAAAIALAVTTAISGSTFAWFTSRDSVKNHLETDQMDDGSVVITENWDPEDGEHLQPGEVLNKDVGAINTGETEALTRISFEEILKKLVTQTTPAIDATKPQKSYSYNIYDGDAAKAPVLVNIGAFSSANGYATVTTGAPGADLNQLNIIPPAGLTEADLQIFLKAVASGDQKTFTFVVASKAIAASGTEKKYDGLYQKLEYTMTLDKTSSGATALKPNATLDFAGKGFVNYEYAPAIEKAWAGLVTSNLTAPVTVAKPVLADLHYIDGTNEPVLNIDFPGQLCASAITDTGKKIKLIFSAAVKKTLAECTPATTTSANWVYNQEDGFFYYLDKLMPGTATKTYLLDALYLDESADNSYNELSFDLFASLEAIQNLENAIRSNTGWNLVATGDSNAIAQFYKTNSYLQPVSPSSAT